MLCLIAAVAEQRNTSISVMFAALSTYALVQTTSQLSTVENAHKEGHLLHLLSMNTHAEDVEARKHALHDKLATGRTLYTFCINSKWLVALKCSSVAGSSVTCH